MKIVHCISIESGLFQVQIRSPLVQARKKGVCPRQFPSVSCNLLLVLCAAELHLH